jgi:hypothetical protein
VQRQDNRATPSGRGSKQERISAKFWEADRIVVRPKEKVVAMLAKNFERLMKNERFKKKFSEKNEESL